MQGTHTEGRFGVGLHRPKAPSISSNYPELRHEAGFVTVQPVLVRLLLRFRDVVFTYV